MYSLAKSLQTSTLFFINFTVSVVYALLFHASVVDLFFFCRPTLNIVPPHRDSI